MPRVPNRNFLDHRDPRGVPTLNLGAKTLRRNPSEKADLWSTALRNSRTRRYRRIRVRSARIVFLDGLPGHQGEIAKSKFHS